MDKKQTKDKNDNIEKMKYKVMGDVFLGNLIDASSDLDNSGLNLALYMDAEEIQEINDKYQKKDK